MRRIDWKDAPPGIRVRRALGRLTRNRWMSGKEVSATALRLASCCCRSPHVAAYSAYAVECEIVGMIRGEPPAYRFEPSYGLALYAAKQIERNKSLVPEIVLLREVMRLQ